MGILHRYIKSVEGGKRYPWWSKVFSQRWWSHGYFGGCNLEVSKPNISSPIPITITITNFRLPNHHHNPNSNPNPNLFTYQPPLPPTSAYPPHPRLSDKTATALTPPQPESSHKPHFHTNANTTPPTQLPLPSPPPLRWSSVRGRRRRKLHWPLLRPATSPPISSAHLPKPNYGKIHQ